MLVLKILKHLLHVEQCVTSQKRIDDWSCNIDMTFQEDTSGIHGLRESSMAFLRRVATRSEPTCLEPSTRPFLVTGDGF